MRLQGLEPMFRTWDLPGTVAFYRDRLGFRCASLDEAAGWAALERDGVRLMLSGPNAHEGDEQPAFTGSLYFRTDDVDGLWRTLRGTVKVSYPIESFDYGMREFAIYDNNGYLLQFGQELPAPETDTGNRSEGSTR